MNAWWLFPLITLLFAYLCCYERIQLQKKVVKNLDGIHAAEKNRSKMR